MDTETTEVETLRTDIHRVEAEVRRVETSLTAEIGRVETSLTAKMYELNGDTKRHADIQFESVRDDIRMVAEAVVALGTKVDSLRR